MTTHVQCPVCGSTAHRAYTKGKRRFRAALLPGNVATKGRACLSCGLPFLVLETPMDTPAGMTLWRSARERHESGA